MTLLAHLLPRVTSRVEDAATDSLAFILNRSDECTEALNGLLEYPGFPLRRIDRVETQVTEDEKSRPDMVGYDRRGRKRLLVEAKFWAGLQHEQATRYFEKLENKRPSVLLFICPDSRIETLWARIRRQMKTDGFRFKNLESPRRTRRAGVIGTRHHVFLISWSRLLDRLGTAVPRDGRLASDIQQLRGLAKYQDEEAFLPIHPQEFGLAFPRRMRGLNRLIDDIVARGVSKGWMSTKGLKATAHRDGYGRYVSLRDVPGGTVFLCSNYRLWTTSGDTPVWLRISPKVPYDPVKLRSGIPSLVDDTGHGSWKHAVPITLKTGVEYQSVLDDAFHQVKEIADGIKAAL